MSIKWVNLLNNGNVTLKGGKEYSVGRRSECDIVLSNDPSISRKHARVLIRTTTSGLICLLYDHSTYGTKINGKRMKTCSMKSLRYGDVIQFGTSRDYLYRVTKSGASKKKSKSLGESLRSSINKGTFNSERPKSAKRGKRKGKRSKSTSKKLAFKKKRRPASAKVMSPKPKERPTSPSFLRETISSQNKQTPTTPLSPENFGNSMELYRPSSPTSAVQVTSSPLLRKHVEHDVLGTSFRAKSPTLKKAKKKSLKDTVSRIIEREETECGNVFYTVLYANGRTDKVLRELLEMRGYLHLIEEFDGSRDASPYEDYYFEALRNYKKRLGYYQYKHPGMWVAVDNNGDCIVIGIKESEVKKQLVSLRNSSRSLSNQYLAPYVTKVPKKKSKIKKIN